VFDTGNPVHDRDRSQPQGADGAYPKQSSWEFYSKVKAHVEGKALKRQSLAVEHKRASAGRDLRVGAQSEPGGDARRLGSERHVEIDLLDQIIGGGVVFQEFGLAAGLVHGGVPSPSLLEGGAANAKPEP